MVAGERCILGGPRLLSSMSLKPILHCRQCAKAKLGCMRYYGLWSSWYHRLVECLDLSTFPYLAAFDLFCLVGMMEVHRILNTLWVISQISIQRGGNEGYSNQFGCLPSSPIRSRIQIIGSCRWFIFVRYEYTSPKLRSRYRL